jgi:hypothetical protein
MVVEAFRPSCISNGPSPILLFTPPAIAGKVGSSFGLYPYSSTSFLLMSSASFRCFRLLQKNKPASTRRATPAIGTITSTAVFPPPLSPPDDVLFPVSASPGIDVDDELEVCDVARLELDVTVIIVVV